MYQLLTPPHIAHKSTMCYNSEGSTAITPKQNRGVTTMIAPKTTEARINGWIFLTLFLVACVGILTIVGKTGARSADKEPDQTSEGFYIGNPPNE